MKVAKETKRGERVALLTLEEAAAEVANTTEVDIELASQVLTTGATCYVRGFTYRRAEMCYVVMWNGKFAAHDGGWARRIGDAKEFYDRLSAERLCPAYGQIEEVWR